MDWPCPLRPGTFAVRVPMLAPAPAAVPVAVPRPVPPMAVPPWPCHRGHPRGRARSYAFSRACAPWPWPCIQNLLTSWMQVPLPCVCPCMGLVAVALHPQPADFVATASTDTHIAVDVVIPSEGLKVDAPFCAPS